MNIDKETKTLLINIAFAMAWTILFCMSIGLSPISSFFGGMVTMNILRTIKM